jgi:hypothetical protein
MQLQPRDVEILRAVSNFGALSSDHLFTLLQVKTPGAVRRVQERLKRLFHNGYLHRPPQQITLQFYRKTYSNQYGNAKFGNHMVYTITQSGADIAFADDPDRRSQISWQTRLHKRQFLNLWHALMISDIHIPLSLLNSKKHGIILNQWQQGEDINRHAPKVEVRSRGVVIKKTVNPDAYFILEKNGNVSHFFLEVDRSTMTTTRYTEKLQAYWQLWKEKKHASHYGIGKNTGFRVLTVTISETRAENLRQAAKKADDVGKGSNMFYFACSHHFDFSKPETILQAVWKTPGGEDGKSIA